MALPIQPDRAGEDLQRRMGETPQIQVCQACFYSVLEAPLAVITASSLIGYDAGSLAHLYLGSFSHSSLQILSSSVRLDGQCRCTSIFRSPQICSIGFWLGQSRTFRNLSGSQSCVVLAVCLGSLSCWKVNLHPSLRTLEHVFIKDLPVLCSVLLCLDPDLSPSLCRWKNIPNSMMLPPPCFTVEMVPGFRQM